MRLPGCPAFDADGDVPVPQARGVPAAGQEQVESSVACMPELHAHSRTFLDRASTPELVEAARLGACALALTDHDGCTGRLRFASGRGTCARSSGAELSLGATARTERRIHPAAPAVLARGPEGYRRLSR